MLGSTERFRSFVFVLSSIREEFSTEQEQYNSFRAVLFLFCPSIRNGLKGVEVCIQQKHSKVGSKFPSSQRNLKERIMAGFTDKLHAIQLV